MYYVYIYIYIWFYDLYDFICVFAIPLSGLFNQQWLIFSLATSAYASGRSASVPPGKRSRWRATEERLASFGKNKNYAMTQHDSTVSVERNCKRAPFVWTSCRWSVCCTLLFFPLAQWSLPWSTVPRNNAKVNHGDTMEASCSMSAYCKPFESLHTLNAKEHKAM